VRIGYFLATEQFTPAELLAQARAAERAGFHGIWISDHYHPWNAEQGQSPFVWSVLGALAGATSHLRVTTAVTCPTVRIHPAIIAQAAATTAVMLEGRFLFGVGSGEALNEHILGDPWPIADVRLEMLEEAIELIRRLWSGDTVSHLGRHYRAEHARLYTLPDALPPILVSGFGPKAAELAGRVGDGYCITMPDAELISRFRAAGGSDGLVQTGVKVCYASDEAEARTTVRRLWPNEALPGELAQVLPTPQHFEQATDW
jgi:G6PDH family F420-dependent oxidoreductase